MSIPIAPAVIMGVATPKPIAGPSVMASIAKANDTAIMQVAKKPAKPRVTNEQFVKAYVNCHSTEHCASMLGLTATSVSTRANKLRKAGVKLPKYDRASNPKTIDVDGLNKLLSE